MVRLKAISVVHNTITYIRFNSKMVRLKASANFLGERPMTGFQFQNGTIKRHCGHTETGSGYEFQFQNGTIKS